MRRWLSVIVLILLLAAVPLSLVMAHDGGTPIPNPSIDTAYYINIPNGTYADYSISHMSGYTSGGVEFLNITKDYALIRWHVDGVEPLNGTVLYGIGQTILANQNNNLSVVESYVPVFLLPVIAVHLNMQDQIQFGGSNRISRIATSIFLDSVHRVVIEENTATGIEIGWDWETGLLLYLHTPTIAIDIQSTNAFQSYLQSVNSNPPSWINIVYFIAVTALKYLWYLLGLIFIIITVKYAPRFIRSMKVEKLHDPEAERLLTLAEQQQEEVKLD
jgi:hypothetical protein